MIDGKCQKEQIKNNGGRLTTTCSVRSAALPAVELERCDQKNDYMQNTYVQMPLGAQRVVQLLDNCMCFAPTALAKGVSAFDSVGLAIQSEQVSEANMPALSVHLRYPPPPSAQGAQLDYLAGAPGGPSAGKVNLIGSFNGKSPRVSRCSA